MFTKRLSSPRLTTICNFMISFKFLELSLGLDFSLEIVFQQKKYSFLLVFFLIYYFFSFYFFSPFFFKLLFCSFLFHKFLKNKPIVLKFDLGLLPFHLLVPLNRISFFHSVTVYPVNIRCFACLYKFEYYIKLILFYLF